MWKVRKGIVIELILNAVIIKKRLKIEKLRRSHMETHGFAWGSSSCSRPLAPEGARTHHRIALREKETEWQFEWIEIEQQV